MGILEQMVEIAFKEFPIIKEYGVRVGIRHEPICEYDMANKICWISDSEKVYDFIMNWPLGKYPLRTIVEYLADNPPQEAFLAFAALHELGHAYHHAVHDDYAYDDMDLRLRYELPMKEGIKDSRIKRKLYRTLPSERDADLFAMDILGKLLDANYSPEETRLWLNNVHEKWKKEANKEYGSCRPKKQRRK